MIGPTLRLNLEAVITSEGRSLTQRSGPEKVAVVEWNKVFGEFVVLDQHKAMCSGMDSTLPAFQQCLIPFGIL